MGETFSAEAILSAVDRGFTSTMKKAQNSVSALGKISSGLKFGALTTAGGKMFTTLASGARGFVSELNASQATWKTFESNMKNLEKSPQAINKVKGALQDFATKSIYSASDMASTYSQLSAVGTKNTTDLVKAFGGLAAAAENPQQAMKTLSQQATQMAAKPKVQWMDFKLMLEQTPAGINEVAKAMGKTTGQLVKDVQDGKVKTEDFFNAMRKAGGEGTALNKMATQYKTMGQAIDGVKESLTTKLAPAWDVVSDYGIKAIGKFEGVLGKIDGNKIAKVLSVGLSKASSVASKVFSKIAPVAASAGKTLYNFGKAVFDVGRSIATNKTVVDGFKKTLSTLGNGVTKVSGFMSKHSSTIGKVAPLIALLAAGYLSLNKATGILGKVGAKSATTGLSGISTALNKLNPTGVLALAGSVGTFVAALGAMSAMRGIIIPFLSGLVGVFGQVMEVIRANTDVILTLVNGALTALANAIVTVAPAMQPIAAAFASLSPLITAVGTAIATILPALGPVITALGTAIATVADAVGGAVSKIVSAFTPMVSIISNAIVKIVKALAPYTPEITKMVEATSSAIQAVASAFQTLFSNLSSIINSITGLVTALGTQIQGIFTSIGTVIQTFATGACSVISTFGNTVSQILTSVGNVFTTFGNAVSTVMNAVSGVVTSVGGAIKSVLDGVAGIFDSMGTAALNAGKGVKLLASGIKTLVGLSLGDLAGTLTAVAIGLGKMASNGAGVAKAGAAIGKIASSCSSAASGLNSVSSSGAKLTSVLARLVTAAVTTGTKLATAGKTGGTGFATGLNNGLKTATTRTTTATNQINQKLTTAARKARTSGTQAGQGFTQGLRTGMAPSPNVATSTVNTVASRIRAGYGAAFSAGKHIGDGVAAGLRSALGSVRSAANAIVSQANRAAAAKAKIHSPSRLFAKEVGKPMARGVAVGMMQGIPDVEKAAGAVVTGAMKKARKKAKKKSALQEALGYSRNAAKSISGKGRNLVRSVVSQLRSMASRSEGQYSNSWSKVQKTTSDGLTANQNTLLKGAKTYTKTLTDKYFKADKLQKQSDKYAKQIKNNKTQIKALQLANRTASDAQKKANQKRINAINKQNLAIEKKQNALGPKLKDATKKSAALQKKVYAQYEKQIKAETASIQSAIESQIGAITSKYQALYDKVASQRSNFESKLKEYGSLFTADEYGYVKFKDWNAQLQEMTTLQSNLQKLQKAGVSQGFLNEITSMSTTDALSYSNALLKKGAGFIRDQSKGYEAVMKKASQVSSAVYKPYVDAIDKAYNVDLVNALKGLDSKLAAIGQGAAQALSKAIQAGYSKGTKKTSGKSAKATAKAAGQSTKAAKKKLKVHSPSKVFSWIGEMTGAGFVRGIDSMGRQISTATMDMIRIPGAESPRLAYAGDGRLNDNYTYGGSKYEITVVSEIDGKEFARATVDPMSEELNRKNRNANRSRGQR